MRKLRVIGSSEDFEELILSNKERGRTGSHVVAIDKRLLDVLQKAVYGRRDQARVRPVVPAKPEIESKLPLKEIQQSLRGGQSPAQIARAAGVTEEYVEQFLTPVLYERAGVIADAQALFQEKQRLGPSSLPLGEAVAANLASRRVRLDEEGLADAWTATRQEGQPWVISLTFPFRGRARTARWRFDQRTHSLEPANKLAIDVGWIGGSRARAYIASANGSKSGEKATAKKPARKKPARKKASPRKKPTRRPSSRKPARRKPAARKKAPPRKKATRRATSRKPARRKPAARKKAPARRKPAARKKTSARRKPARRARRR
ncbi:MAG TPA: septation protein SepH [Actinomycetota bacterium]|nr:septation protein SepH [Actinomycetota bacterium]